MTVKHRTKPLKAVTNVSVQLKSLMDSKTGFAPYRDRQPSSLFQDTIVFADKPFPHISKNEDAFPDIKKPLAPGFSDSVLSVTGNKSDDS